MLPKDTRNLTTDDKISQENFIMQNNSVYSQISLIHPSLGQPLLVSIDDKKVATFDVIVAVESCKNSLDEPDKLREVLEKENEQIFFLSAVRNNEQTHQLILQDVTCDDSSSRWHLISTECFSKKVKFFRVTLSLDESYSKISQERQFELFNLHLGEQQCQKHALCLTRQDWSSFSFIHATDLHIAKRNDDIPELIQLKDTEDNYINFNQHLRELIKTANQLAANGELDFIILTGDLVDFVCFARQDDKESQINDSSKITFEKSNWYILYKILTGTDSKSEPLEVPVFTLLGNHDYRFHHYNLDNGSDRWKDFGLTKYQFKKYRKYEPKVHFPVQLEAGLGALKGYFLNINSELDYIIPLGEHQIVCLDTGKDEFDAVDAERMLKEAQKSKPTKNLIDFIINRKTKELIRFLLPRVILGIVAGGLLGGVIELVINIKPFWLTLLGGFVGGVIMTAGYLVSAFKGLKGPLRYYLDDLASALEGIVGGGPDSVGLFQEQLDWTHRYLNQRKNSGLRIFAMHHPPVNSPPGVNLKQFREKQKENGWIDIKEIDLSSASIHQNWLEFLEVLTGVDGESPGDFVLCGHTHRNLEFRLERYPASKGRQTRFLKDKLGFYTDKYIQQLNQQEDNQKDDWWHQHSPLILQGTSLGPFGKKEIPSGYHLIQVKNHVINKIKFCNIRNKKTL